MEYNKEEFKVAVDIMLAEKYPSLVSIAKKLTRSNTDTQKDDSELITETYLYVIESGAEVKNVRNVYHYFCASMTNMARHDRLGYGKITKPSSLIKSKESISDGSLDFLFAEDNYSFQDEEDYFRLVILSVAIMTLQDIYFIGNNIIKATLSYYMYGMKLSDVAEEFGINPKKVGELVRITTETLRKEAVLLRDTLDKSI